MTTSEIKIQNLENAIREADRFVNKANQALRVMRDNDLAAMTGTRETGAAKRASMDLSNALVKVRNPKTHE